MRPSIHLRSLLLASLLIALFSSSASAETFSVTTTDDVVNGACTSTCSVRDALIASSVAPTDDTVRIPAGTYRLSISGVNDDAGLTGDLDVQSNGALAIEGEGSRTTTIDASELDQRDRVLDIVADGVGDGVTRLSGLRITGGEVSADETPRTEFQNNIGGGGINSNAEVAIVDSRIDGNSAPANAGVSSGVGGGVFLYRGASYSVARTSIVDNDAGRIGGGAIVLTFGTGSTVSISDTTVSGNDVGALDSDDQSVVAGLYAGAAGQDGNSSLVNSTISDNRALGAENNTSAGAPGLYFIGTVRTASGVLVADNEVVGPTTPYIADDCVGSIASDSANLQEDDSCFTGPATITTETDVPVAADNGGQSDTVAITKASPAFDAGIGPITTASDGRGRPRPAFAASDLGAYELQPSADLSVSGSKSAALITVGDTVTHSFSVRNSGDAGEARLALSSNGEIVSITTDRGSCSGLECELGTLADGGQATVSVVVRARSTGDLVTEGTVTGVEDDPTNENNTAQVGTIVDAASTGGSGEPRSPIVSTGATRTPSQYAATLLGSVDAEGGSVTARFEYGRTASYGSTTADQRVSGDEPVDVEALLRGLQLGVTYHYRLVVVDANGRRFEGADRTFTSLGRQRARRLSITASPAYDRIGPRTFRFFGRLSLPSTVAASDGCAGGRVAVQIKAGSTTISNRRVRLSSTCRWSSRVHLRVPSRFAGRSRLTVRAVYAGNKAVQERPSRRITVRVR